MKSVGFEQWIVVITVITASMLQLIDTSIVNVTLGQMMGNLGATLGEISWVITAYAVANVIMIALSGWCSAYFGRRNYFLASIILFTVSSVFCGMSTNVWELVFFRFIQGLAGGGLMPVSQAIIVETFPREQMGMANAIYGMGVVIGPTIGPALGGWLTDHMSWPWVFYVNVPIGIMASFLTWTYIKEPPEGHAQTKKMDWGGLALLMAGVGPLQVVLERGPAENWFESGWITFMTLLSALSCVAFIWWELRSKHPMVQLRLFFDKYFALGSVFNFVLGFGLFGTVFVIPVFCQSFLGFTALDTGLLLVPGSLATAFCMPFIGKLMQKKFPAWIMSAMGFVAFLFFCVILENMTADTGTGDFYWPLIMRGIGLGLIFIPLNVMTLANLKGAELGQATGLTNMLRQLGGSFGVAIVTTFLTNRTAFHTAVVSEKLSETSSVVQERFGAFVAKFTAEGMSLWEAKLKALMFLKMNISKQATLLAFNDVFVAMSFLFGLCIPLMFLYRSQKPIAGAPPVSHGE